MSEKYTSTKSVWALALEASRRPGATFSPVQYSTLNEYFGIQSGTALPSDAQPQTQYITIGRGGHRNVVGGTGDSLTDMLQHRINNARLFEHLPFVLRTTDNDLTAAQRSRYRLRKLETYGGTQYFAYYMLRVDLPAATPVIEELTIADGNVTRAPYTPTAAQLTPQPVSMTNGVVNQSTGTHFEVSAPFRVELTKTDITEILNAVEIIYGDPRYAVISELGICSGIDQTVTSTEAGVTATYTEVLAAQIFNWISANINLMYQSQRLVYDLRIGSTLPYLT